MSKSLELLADKTFCISWEPDNTVEYYCVLENPDGIWQQLTYIKASNTQAGSFFGLAISLSANGDTMAIGARMEASTTTNINGDRHAEPSATLAAAAVYLY